MTDPAHKTDIVAIEPLQPGGKVHPVVATMLRGNLDPIMLRELLAVQRDWEAGEARKAYTRALVELRRDLPAVIDHDRLVDFTGARGRVRYTHTSLAHAMDAVTEPLAAHGFSISWTPKTASGKVEVTCRLTHADGHYQEATIDAPPDTSGLKSAAQGIASTITLLERYSLLSLLGIATADMEEPTGATADGGAVDPERNLRACAALAKSGRSKQAAEQLVGRPVAEWTSADLDRLRTWMASPPAAGGASPTNESSAVPPGADSVPEAPAPPRAPPESAPAGRADSPEPVPKDDGRIHSADLPALVEAAKTWDDRLAIVVCYLKQARVLRHYEILWKKMRAALSPEKGWPPEEYARLRAAAADIAGAVRAAQKTGEPEPDLDGAGW